MYFHILNFTDTFWSIIFSCFKFSHKNHQSVEIFSRVLTSTTWQQRMSIPLADGPLYQYQLSLVPQQKGCEHSFLRVHSLRSQRSYDFTSEFTHERIQPNVLENVISTYSTINICPILMDLKFSFHGTLSNHENRENYIAQKFLGIR